MKKALFILSAIVLASCSRPEAGTIQKVSAEHHEVELYKYYYQDGSYVYVGRFKDDTTAVSTTWFTKSGKTTRQNTLINKVE